VGVFLNDTFAIAIDLRGRDMDELPEIVTQSKLLKQTHLGKHVGLEILLRVKPTLRHHGLGSEIDDVVWTEAIEFLHQADVIMVEVSAHKAERSTFGGRTPLVGQVGLWQFF
jgi:hypothetical protein